MRVSRRAVVFSACLTAVILWAPVQAQQASITTTIDTTLINVGDRITLSVTVDHEAGAQVIWPDSLALSPFEVLAANVAAPRPEGDRVRTAATVTITVFELGEIEIPGFDVAVVSSVGDTTSLRTDRFAVEVASVGADESGDIREIRGPVSIPIGARTFAFWAFLLAVAGLVGALLYRRLTHANEAGLEDTEPPRPAHEIALEALDAIASSSMLLRGEVKEFHMAASEVVRTYLEQRFAVPAMEMTTFEVMQNVRRGTTSPAGPPMDQVIEVKLERFLQACDLVKFAKVRPSTEQANSALEEGRSIVLETIPPPPVVSDEEVPS